MIAIRPVSVRTLLEMGVLGEAKVIGGIVGLDREVTHVTIVGAPLMEPWIKENELVMTTGYPYRDDPSGITEMMLTLVNKKAAALVFKEGLYLPSMLIPEAIRVAEEAALPVIRVSKGTVWADVIESIYLVLLRGSGNAANRGLLTDRLKDSPAISYYRKVISKGYEDPPADDHAESGSMMIKEHETYSLFLMRTKDAEAAREAAGILRSALLEHSLEAVSFAEGRHVVVVWPKDGGPLLQDAILKRAGILVKSLDSAGARSALPVAAPTFGVALSGLRHAFAQARDALDALKVSRARQETIWYPESGLVELLLGAMDSDRVREFCRRSIGPLIDHDREKGGDLVKSLETYLEQDCSVSSAAEALFIHPSTLKQRLKKMEKLLGFEGLNQDFELKAELYIALKMNRLVREG